MRYYLSSFHHLFGYAYFELDPTKVLDSVYLFGIYCLVN